MYSRHFGLEKKPFPLLPAGADVFVGPQAAELFEKFGTAFAENDAVVNVSGPCGAGKTTLVKWALKATGLRRQIVTIGGEPLQPDEVLASLLMLFGIEVPPDNKAEQLAAWRQLLSEVRAADMHVFILIENALETGTGVIEELAALSEAEGESSPGARMIIMGDETLGDVIEDSQLAHLQERISLTHCVSPFCEAEIRGYLKHGLRTAGGDFDAIFEDDCIALLLQLSEGIPRAVNAIVTTAIGAASDQDICPVTAKLIARVAAEAFDKEADRFDFRKLAGATATGDWGAGDEKQVPDLDALAHAIAMAQGARDTAPQVAKSGPHTESWTERSLALTETARERTITCGMDSAGEFGLATDIVPPTVADTAEDLEEVARRLAEARTLDDIDDTMAETLFGSELAEIASIVTDKKTAAPAANDQTSVSEGRKQSAS